MYETYKFYCAFYSFKTITHLFDKMQINWHYSLSINSIEKMIDLETKFWYLMTLPLISSNNWPPQLSTLLSASARSLMHFTKPRPSRHRSKVASYFMLIPSFSRWKANFQSPANCGIPAIQLISNAWGWTSQAKHPWEEYCLRWTLLLKGQSRQCPL